MRNGQNKRMRGRNRNKGHHGGGHQHHHNPLTRVYESNGPEVKIRGTAHHVAEKYVQLARDASSSGDYVTAENYHQHAEHYFRLIAAAQEQLRQQNPYYQPQQATSGADNTVGTFDDSDDDGQPMQGQQGFGQQPPNYGNQQPPYPPREQQQPQLYGGQQPQQQNRPQQQPQQPQQPQQQPQPPQQFQQPPQPPANFDSNDGLPSFITGGQPPQPQPAQPLQQGNPNGYDNQSGDRFPRHRRRRHRGPRPDLQPAQQEFRGDEGPEPGNG